MSLPLACELVAVFKRHEAWCVHTRLGFLWAIAECVVTCARPQVVRRGSSTLTSSPGTESPALKKRKMKSVVTVPTATTTRAVTPLVLNRHRPVGRSDVTSPPEDRFTVTKARHRSPSPDRLDRHHERSRKLAADAPVAAQECASAYATSETAADDDAVVANPATAALGPRLCWQSCSLV